ncbi:50S ribosomal protein L6 [Candidatus Jorgensenbacteria bacterium]|nr:50S ribosomal protein L6 [Candidatus Jorgensenbacteria bacterium]
MSKIGRQLIKIPVGTTVSISEGNIVVKGSVGEKHIPILDGVKPLIDGDQIQFSLVGSGKRARSNWGTLRSLVNNAILGLTKGYEKILVLEGIGYRVVKEGNDLALNLGFSHPIRYTTPPGISFDIEKNSILKIKGFDKERVGQVAAEIRSLKKPEPYKGKGFRYSNEVVRRKAGKKATSTAGGSA